MTVLNLEILLLQHWSDSCHLCISATSPGYLTLDFSQMFCLFGSGLFDFCLAQSEKLQSVFFFPEGMVEVQFHLVKVLAKYSAHADLRQTDQLLIFSYNSEFKPMLYDNNNNNTSLCFTHSRSFVAGHHFLTFVSKKKLVLIHILP